MIAQELIDELDRALVDVGQNVTVKRDAATITCRASVRATGDMEAVGTIKMTEFVATISPTEIAAAGWPTGSATVPVSGTDVRIPKANDKIVINGKERQISRVEPYYVNGTWVRADIYASG